ncbi:MAG TPA: tetratricopeptide repeat protein [Polyangiaceae bacterium]|jgi:Flp pilus assembly protein TadD
MKKRAVDVDQLARDVEWAIDHRLPVREQIAMLNKLLSHAEQGSVHQSFAKGKLAELLLEAEPWRAARLAHEQLAVHRDDDRLWAVLGLAHTLLGNLRSAARAYREALALSPCCALYAHNLGHLLDAGLDRPVEALGLLKRAFADLAHEPEVAGSYAHALLRCGRAEEAKRVLTLGLGGDERAAEALLADWLGRKRAALGPVAESRNV